MLCNRKTLQRLARLASALIAMALATNFAYGQTQDINALKAAYIFNFSKFVEWDESSSEIVICLDTDNRWIFRQLKSLEGKTVNSKPFRVLSLLENPEVDIATGCHVLYKDKIVLEAAEPRLRGVLIVSDAMDAESIIAFIIKDGRLTFEINARRAEQQGVNISSRLLRLAKRVYK